MGTPEFPDLGKHCLVEDCKQIDFLPFTCDRCLKVYCLEHRSYGNHRCPKANKGDVTVVICPLCAKGVRLNPDEDANITWEKHVNTDCDPSNYQKVKNKKKCPVPRCKELLTFSNTIKCRDCSVDHCLKHRFGPDHKCPGPPKKPDTAFPFMGLLSMTRKEESRSNQASTSSSSNWASVFNNGIARLGEVLGSSSGSEECPQCGAKFSSVATLVKHVEKMHEKNKNKGRTIDACPKCSRGFYDPVALVQHVERDHGGTSKS